MSRQIVRVNRKKMNTHLKKEYPIKEKKKQKHSQNKKKKNILFNYLNKNAKRNKQ